MQDELDLRHYVGVVRRHLALVIVTTIFVGAAALGASLLEKPRYRATATILFTPQAQSFTGNSTEDPARVLSTLASLASNNTILGQAASKLGSNETVLSLSKTISINTSADQDILRLSATDTSARRAARKANAVTAAFLAWRTTTLQTVT
ncbi:MAG: Wzz/FepE/Etk N-terminal domain-containing protein, partial [Gaiellaceae bacterium]